MDMLRALQRILASLGVHTNIQNFLMLFFLIFTRVASALNLTPFLGGKTLPSQIKVGLAVMIAALLLPGLNKTAGPMPDNFLFYCALQPGVGGESNPSFRRSKPISTM